MKWSPHLIVVQVVWIILHRLDWSYGEVKMIWKYPPSLNSSRAVMERIERSSTCDLSRLDDNVTINSLQVVFMTKRCIGGYCRDPVRDRGIEGLMLIECTDIFEHVQDLGMDAVALLEDACNACSNVADSSDTDALVNDTAIIEGEKSGWWSVGSWTFWKSSTSDD